MKKIIKQLYTPLFLLALAACEKAENKIYFEGGTNPVLTASTQAVVLEPGLENQRAIRFSWTNPEYRFTTGVSSHDVKYTLEIDTLGGNFRSGKKFTTVISKDLVKEYTVGELNSIMGNTMILQLRPRRSYTFEARITASLGTNVNVVPLTSNVVRFTATPFQPPPKVPVPTAGTLWITGDAVASGWSNPLNAPYDVTQKFTVRPGSDTDYELTIAMPGGGGYKLIQTQGIWGTQYHMLPGGTWNQGEFELRDADPPFPGPPEPGVYKIHVDFQLGRYSVVKQ